MRNGSSARRIAIGALLVFLVSAGGAGALSNGDGGGLVNKKDIAISNSCGAL